MVAIWIIYILRWYLLKSLKVDKKKVAELLLHFFHHHIFHLFLSKEKSPFGAEITISTLPLQCWCLPLSTRSLGQSSTPPLSPPTRARLHALDRSSANKEKPRDSCEKLEAKDAILGMSIGCQGNLVEAQKKRHLKSNIDRYIYIHIYILYIYSI